MVRHIFGTSSFEEIPPEMNDSFLGVLQIQKSRVNPLNGFTLFLFKVLDDVGEHEMGASSYNVSRMQEGFVLNP